MKEKTPLTALPSPLLIIGGAYDGKSELAATALEPDKQTLVIGTADSGHPGLESRLQLLRDSRPKQWLTTEASENLPGCLSEACSSYEQVLIDSLSQWMAGQIVGLTEDHDSENPGQVIERDLKELIAVLTSAPKSRIVLVSAVVGGAPASPRPVERLYRQTVGLMNQRLARACASVIQVTAGLWQRLR